MTTIGIIDDHRIVRDGIKAMLLLYSEFQVCAESDSLKGMQKLMLHQDINIMLIDLRLKEENGLNALKKLKTENPEIKCILISGDWDSQSLKQALTDDAYGALSKESSEGTFVDCLRRVSEGDKFVDPALSNLLMLKQQSSDIRSVLSPREIEVLQGFARGQSYKAIAGNLFISTRTVETHKNNILRKLQVETTFEMIRVAIDHKLV